MLPMKAMLFIDLEVQYLYMSTIVTWQRYMLILMIFFLPFTHFSISFPLIGDAPYLLFLLIGYILFIFECLILGKSLSEWEKLGCIFLCIMVIWKIVTGVIGIIDYQYFGQINLTQMDNFKNLYDNVSSHFSLNEEFAIKSWLIYKAVRSAFLNVAYSYLISFWIYHIYEDNWQIAIHDLKKITVILCGALSLYSVFEVNYLIGGGIGKSLLATINPLYMTIADIHNWWPPLFWDGQVRSLFAEPSFFGIYTAMAIPILLSFFFDSKITFKSFIGIAVYVFIVTMLVLSKARSGTVLFCIEFLMAIIWTFVYQRKYWKRLVFVGICTCLAFFMGLGILTQFKSHRDANRGSVSVESYVSQNVASVVGNKRSNSARFANVYATVMVGLQNPLIGVGPGLKDVYLDKNLQQEDRLIPEVANWSNMMYENGPLKSSYPTLNHLAGVFAEEGVWGLIIFIVPIFGTILAAIKYRKCFFNTGDMFLLISFIGLCCAFFSNTATVEFYIMMGFMALISKKNKEINDGK